MNDGAPLHDTKKQNSSQNGTPHDFYYGPEEITKLDPFSSSLFSFHFFVESIQEEDGKIST